MKVTIEAEVVKKEKARGYGYNEADTILYKIHIEGKSTQEVEEKIAEAQKAATHLGVILQ